MSAPLPSRPRTRVLAELLPELAGEPRGNIAISGLGLDSRAIVPGDAFVALRGARHDGTAFAAQAAAHGAVAMLVDRADGFRAPADFALPVLEVSELQTRLSAIAAAFHDHPARAMAVIGVTGTNGKTTCTQLVARVLQETGSRCGVIGTLGWGLPGELDLTRHTTPDALSLQALLARLRERQARAVAVEVSSHALRQGRVAAVEFDTAVFTNLTHDHLDYHGSLEDYGASKALLFQRDELRHALLNIDDDFGRRLHAHALPRGIALSYGLDSPDADVRVSRERFAADGVSARVHTPWGEGELRAPLMGRFNLANLLAVLGAACLQGVPLDAVLAVLPRLQPVSGRMQRIELPGAPLVIVDYAHTPDALGHTLRALRAHCAGRLWCVFGCGGDRDRAKRPLMGRIAWENADELVVTSDNPRSEAPESIIDEICSGVPDAAVRRDTDRARAIAAAVSAAQPGDCVLIAGKGHEDYQEALGIRLPFSDADCARAALAARGGRT